MFNPVRIAVRGDVLVHGLMGSSADFLPGAAAGMCFISLFGSAGYGSDLRIYIFSECLSHDINISEHLVARWLL